MIIIIFLSCNFLPHIHLNISWSSIHQQSDHTSEKTSIEHYFCQIFSCHIFLYCYFQLYDFHWNHHDCYYCSSNFRNYFYLVILAIWIMIVSSYFVACPLSLSLVITYLYCCIVISNQLHSLTSQKLFHSHATHELQKNPTIIPLWL